jgi:hypothetical protein
MTRAIVAGLLYFLAVFAIGFVFGTLRVLVIIPRIGELAAVLVELPMMLALAWPICGALIRRCAVPPGMVPRFVMSAIAFAMLMVAELVLAVWLFGQTPQQPWASFYAPATQLGLAGQVLFALFPLLRRRHD